MSLIEQFWPGRNALCVYLAPEQVCFAMRHGKQFTLDSCWHQDCDNPEGQWQNALALLQSGLQQSSKLPSRCALEVSVGGRWCQYLRLPWSEAMLQPASRQRFVQNQFLALYGEVVRDWQFCLDDAPYGAPRLVCGIEQALLASLQELAQGFELQLRVVEPLLVQAWHSILRLQGREVAAFALIEGERLTLAQTMQGRIIHAHSQYWHTAHNDANWAQALTQAWQRACLREPELALIGQASHAGVVPVLNLSGQALRGELSAPFQLVQMARSVLPPAYAALLCQA